MNAMVEWLNVEQKILIFQKKIFCSTTSTSVIRID